MKGLSAAREFISCLHMGWRLAATAMVAAMMPVGALGLPPAAVEDARIERERLLRAADQLGFLTTQIEGLQAEVSRLRTEMETLKADGEARKRMIEEITANQAADRQKLLDEVSQIVAKSRTAPAPATNAAPAQAAPAAANKEKGYVHKVEKGQTVSAIARAYSAKGVQVTVQDIVKANNLGADARVRPGQDLFIPKKERQP